MEGERLAQFRIGFTVLLAIVGTVILSLIFGPKQGVLSIDRGYSVDVRFETAPGVTEGTPVQKSGILIGRVANVQLSDSAEDRTVLVRLNIDSNRKIFSDEQCRIQKSVLGDATLEFVRNASYPGPVEPINLKVPLEGAPPPPDPLSVVGDLYARMDKTISEVDRTVMSVGAASDELKMLLGTVNNSIGSEQDIAQTRRDVSELIGETKDTMYEIHQLTSALNEMIGDPDSRERMRQAAEQMPEIMARTNRLLEGLETNMPQVEQTLNNMNRITTQLVGPEDATGPSAIDRLNQSILNIEETTSLVRNIVAKMDSQQGNSIQRLMNDDGELYNDVQQVVKNMETITVQLQPILADARIMSDKLARDPGIVGVRGALRPDLGLKSPPRGTLMAPWGESPTPRQEVIPWSPTPYPASQGYIATPEMCERPTGAPRIQ